MKRVKRRWILFVPLIALCLTSPALGQTPRSVVAPNAKITKVGSGYQFTEGPAADAQGNVYFSDVQASRTYKWSVDGRISLFREDAGNTNGLAIDKTGSLLACEGGRGRIVSIDPSGKRSVIADKFSGKRFNQPNDLWIDPRGGVYFSDPIYGRGEKTQSGEHVYCISPDRRRVSCVIDDMVRPNGLAGTPDGKLLYVSDHGARRIYVCEIAADGSISNKRVIAPVGADGMKLDNEGHLFLAEDGILIYDLNGKHIETIQVPEQPTNLCFAGSDGHTLFITARPAIFTLRMRVAGAGFERQKAGP